MKSSKKKIIISLSIIFTLIITYLLTIHTTIDLKEETTSISVFDEYKETGVIACKRDIFGICLKKQKVETEGTIDTNHTGTYEIKYKVNKKQKIKKVEVVDKEKPVITIEKEITACPNGTNIKVDYKAIDNYDKDITEKVTTKVEDKELILEVSDSAGNKTEERKTITFIDKEKPVLTLKGDSTIYIKNGDSYKEPGYIAKDNCIKNITNKVTINGKVDTTKDGKYQIIYKVSDGINETTKIRTVYVYSKKQQEQPKERPTGKVIYLTFDDGPSTYTNELLNILKKHNVKATFFVTSDGSASSITRAYNEGHTIGLHTYTHDYKKIYKSETAYFQDLEKVSKRVENATGHKSYIIRFPGGSSNTISSFNKGIMTRLTKEVEKRGYKYFDWNTGSSDTTTKNSNTIANNVIKRLGNGSNVVLQHDTNQASVKAVEKIIEYGKSNGYTFQKLTKNSPSCHHKVNN